MANEDAFTRVDGELLTVLEELRKREPIFHRADFGRKADDFRKAMAADYWEVGASGRRYTRDLILQHLERHPPVDAEAAGWECAEFGLRRIAPDTYLLTYTLDQAGRITQRATIWRQVEGGWQILYHQGTIVAVQENKPL